MIHIHIYIHTLQIHTRTQARAARRGAARRGAHTYESYIRVRNYLCRVCVDRRLSVCSREQAAQSDTELCLVSLRTRVSVSLRMKTAG